MSGFGSSRKWRRRRHRAPGTLQIRDRAHGEVETIPARFLFVLIGAMPHTDWLQGTVERDAKGFIPTAIVSTPPCGRCNARR